MEITDLEPIELLVPIEGRKYPYHINLVKVTTYARGEDRGQAIPPKVSPLLVESLKPLVVGRSPFDIEVLYDARAQIS